MTAQVTLNLSGQLYDQVKNLAKSYQRGLAEAILAHLEKTLSPPKVTPKVADLRNQRLIALDNEKAAYLKLHPQLLATHPGRYVAIYQGRLFDTDNELGPMVERVRTQLPDQIVWMTQVKDEPIQTIVRRGNRWLREGNRYDICSLEVCGREENETLICTDKRGFPAISPAKIRVYPRLSVS